MSGQTGAVFIFAGLAALAIGLSWPRSTGNSTAGSKSFGKTVVED